MKRTITLLLLSLVPLMGSCAEGNQFRKMTADDIEVISQKLSRINNINEVVLKNASSQDSYGESYSNDKGDYTITLVKYENQSNFRINTTLFHNENDETTRIEKTAIYQDHKKIDEEEKTLDTYSEDKETFHNKYVISTSFTQNIFSGFTKGKTLYAEQEGWGISDDVTLVNAILYYSKGTKMSITLPSRTIVIDSIEKVTLLIHADNGVFGKLAFYGKVDGIKSVIDANMNFLF